jgi:hypothetical protein
MAARIVGGFLEVLEARNKIRIVMAAIGAVEDQGCQQGSDAKG